MTKLQAAATAATANLFYPMAQSHQQGMPEDIVTQVGEHVYGFLSPLVLTPIGAGGSHTMTWTFYKTTLVSDIEFVLSSSFTRVPCSFQCFADSSNSYKHFDVS